jgi:GDP/UDP-N,N'-diacetylbacillosamine 2-epimerase (hydrolysing)
MKMKITCLTSSRSDYGILSPLLKTLSADSFFELDIIAFGTHISNEHGYTIKEILNDGYYARLMTIDTMPQSDAAVDIITSISDCVRKFGEHFLVYKTDVVLCLGDRYEIFAACTGIFPYGIKIAHVSGGEETLGATDNFYRHALTLMATYHFASTDVYKERIVQLIGDNKNIYNVGALNIDNLKAVPFLDKEEFNERFGFYIEDKSILITFHPETVQYEANESYAQELVAALGELKDYQLIITMPNADVKGSTIRKYLTDLVRITSNAVAVKSFGMIGYLSCMKHCSMLLGNTSSGFVEASFFPKYVINLGRRQEGRILTPNIVSCPINKASILEAVKKYESLNDIPSGNIYGDGNSSRKIARILKDIL